MRYILPLIIALAGCGGSSDSDSGMVSIPGGQFMFGSEPRAEAPEPWRSYETPRMSVTVAPFQLARHEVTVGEFAEYAATHPVPKGCFISRGLGEIFFDPEADWRNPGFAQTDRHPVVCVDWHTATAYAAWRGARLPTEAEHEYANRDTLEPCITANVFDLTAAAVTNPGWGGFSCVDGFAFTAPVGSFRANSFGIHDMLGNVHEWTSDCFSERHNAAPTDCAFHVTKGGAWRSPVWLHRSQRSRSEEDLRNYYLGFRLAR